VVLPHQLRLGRTGKRGEREEEREINGSGQKRKRERGREGNAFKCI
jgi:hypothetical protein